MKLQQVQIIHPATAEHLGRVRELFSEYTEVLIAETPAFADYLQMENFADELDNLQRGYLPPECTLLLALVGDESAGCVALRNFGAAGICEIKRLYVKPEFRALKLGKQLTEAIIKEAKLAGYKRMRLETAPTMIRAQNLYFAFGFKQVESYNDENPIDGTLFLELNLD